MPPRPAAAFLSYARFDNQHDEGRLSLLRERLEGEVRIHTGEEFQIFQDRNDIRWGEEWEDRIKELIEAATFFIPILTPSFFKSEHCRRELRDFLAREQHLERKDLILPIYYVTCPLLEGRSQSITDPVFKTLIARHRVDWRDLRHESFENPKIGRRIAELAVQICDSLNRCEYRCPRQGGALELHHEHGAPETAQKIPDSVSGTQRTLLVGTGSSNGFATISAAIAAATDGDRIIVRPEVYREALVLEKPLEIIGDGPLDKIVIDAPSGQAAITCRSREVRVVNLTLRGSFGAVNVEKQGQIRLELCDLKSHHLACIHVSGGSCYLLRNRVHDASHGSGVWLDCADAVLEENEITGNREYGVGVKYSTAALRRNKINSNTRTGIAIFGGSGVFEENDLRFNAQGAWKIRSEDVARVKQKDNIE
jgi:TIR domain/Right handed beta helix region